MGLREELDNSLDVSGVDGRDVAAVGLARRLADEIDADPDALSRLAPKLLAALRELRLTPAARKEVQADDGDDDSEDALAEVVELHAVDASGQDDPADLDAGAA